MKYDIIKLIGEELLKLFPTIAIYRENHKEGFEEPSFFIEKISTRSSPEMFEIQNRKYSYQIVYFPTIDNPKQDMQMVEEILLDNFTMLTDFGNLRNREFNQSTDNTLQMTFEVQIRAHKQDTGIKQQHMKLNGGVAGGG